MRFLFLVLTLVLCMGSAFGNLQFWLNLLGLAPPTPAIAMAPPLPPTIVQSRVTDTGCMPPNCGASWAYKK